jgi:hypothetical protein
VVRGSARTGEGRARVHVSERDVAAAHVPVLVAAPLSTPTPSPDPTSTIEAVTQALGAPQLPVTLATLKAHAAENAIILGHPIPESLSDWAESLPAILPTAFRLPLSVVSIPEYLRHIPTTERTVNQVRHRFTVATPTQARFECALTLIQDPPGSAPSGPDPPEPARCWRLTNLDILRRTG